MVDRSEPRYYGKAGSALLVDNCSAHPKDCSGELTNVVLYFLPPNVTSVIQPCDMGIIRNLKALYQNRMILEVCHA
jgi:hypothetical protein